MLQRTAAFFSSFRREKKNQSIKELLLAGKPGTWESDALC